MDELVQALLFIIVGAVGVGVPAGVVIVALIFLFSPEKVEKWIAIFAKLLSGLGGAFRSLHKQYVRLDLQAHINSYVKSTATTIPYLQSKKVKVELQDGNIDRDAFIKDGNVMLRLRRDDPDELNLVHGAYLFVSTSLLSNVKRYISPSQREALDLYVTAELLETERHEVKTHFLDTYLFPAIGDSESKRLHYYEKLDVINDAGVMYPVLLQELDFLGRKVFGGPKKDTIIIEVDALIAYLESFANRTVGDEGEKEFTREYCRFNVMIIGRRAKLAREGIQPYVNHIRNQLIPNKIENIYLIGSWDNRETIELVCHELTDTYETIACKKTQSMLHYSDGREETVDTCVTLIRQRNAPIFQGIV